MIELEHPSPKGEMENVGILKKKKKENETNKVEADGIAGKRSETVLTDRVGIGCWGDSTWTAKDGMVFICHALGLASKMTKLQGDCKVCTNTLTIDK